jgi:hypothetical protein
MPRELQINHLDGALLLNITDEDIQSIARSMRCSFDNPHRQQTIKCLSSCDVQAGPGSGKTTLLVAKLAILSTKWPWRDRGICVLSHTNAARHEVEKRLKDHPTAYRLLSYPHFIGTIQTFVDQFLALPFLRSQNIEVSVIDNDRFASRASFLLGSQYRAAYNNLNYRNQLYIATGLRVEGSELKLGCAFGKIGVNETTKTFRDLYNLKRQTLSEGFYRFDDMYALGECYIKRNPLVVKYLRMRFPFVFVDEMQDTDSLQNHLLEILFGDGCILQRFGDINQAIFHGEDNAVTNNNFPQVGYISVPDCLRFGKKIAAIASPFTAVEEQTLTGNENRAQRRHTIFLFNDTSILSVLPSFGDLILELYQEKFPANFVAKAIGFRKSGSVPDKLPYAISDYWPGFRPQFSAQSSSPDCLMDFVTSARHILYTHRECQSAYGLLTEGIIQFLHIQGATPPSGLKFTKTRLVTTLADDARERFENLLATFLLSETPTTPEVWRLLTETLVEITAIFWEGDLSPASSDFLAWPDRGTVHPVEPAPSRHPSINLYRHESSNGSGSVDIEVATIHRVKGETHTATLVLETYNHEHDIQKLFPFLIEYGDRRLLKKVRLKNHMKCFYVAITRPQELLCLAMHKNHIQDGGIDLLQKQGWAICDLTTSPPPHPA